MTGQTKIYEDGTSPDHVDGHYAEGCDRDRQEDVVLYNVIMPEQS